MALAQLSIVPIRVLLIDDHSIFRAGLRLLIERHPGIVVVGEANTYSDALAVARHEQPDIIILNAPPDNSNALDKLAELLSTLNQSRVVILTRGYDTGLYQRAAQLGVMGFVSKETEPEVLIKAIEKVHSGEAWIDRRTMARVLTEIARPAKKDISHTGAAQIESLTKREREIITYVAQGLKNKVIADRLFISDITVRHHLTNIFNKLDVADRFELIIFAYKHGLCAIPD